MPRRKRNNQGETVANPNDGEEVSQVEQRRKRPIPKPVSFRFNFGLYSRF